MQMQQVTQKHQRDIIQMGFIIDILMVVPFLSHNRFVDFKYLLIWEEKQ